MQCEMASIVSISHDFSSEEDAEIESDHGDNSVDDGSDVAEDDGSDLDAGDGSDVDAGDGSDVVEDDGSDVDADEGRDVDIDDGSDVGADAEESDDDNTGPPKKKKKDKSCVSQDEAPAGLADVFAKILNKEAPKHRVPILSKAKTDHQLHIAKLQKQQESQPEKTDSLSKILLSYQKQQEHVQKRKRWENMSRVKPDVLDKDKERSLQKAATKGVVLLFNTVRKQQKCVDEKIKEVGPSEYKKDKVLKSVSKVKFLDMLKETTPNVTTQGSQDVLKLKTKREKAVDNEADDDKPSWSILKEDFMMGGSMKDWDKQDSDEDVVHSKYQDFNSSDSDT